VTIEKTNLDLLKDYSKEAYELVTSIHYGEKARVDEEGNVLYGPGGKILKEEVNIYEEFDNYYNIDMLLDFLENIHVINKNSALLLKDGEISEMGFEGIAIIKAKFPGLAGDKLIRMLMDYKRDADKRYQNMEYKFVLGASSFERYGNNIIIKMPMELKPLNKYYLKLYEELTEEELLALNEFIETTLFKFTRVVIRGAFYRKFYNKFKKSLWHFVDERDSGKTTWIETINEVTDIFQNDNLERLLGERAKVDVDSLNKSLFIFQDEATVMYNSFKLLTSSTLKLDLAYARKQVIVDAPLVVMCSHEDIQETYNEQFQARVIKIYSDTGDVKDKVQALIDSGISISKIQAFNYMYVRQILEEEMVYEGSYDDVEQFIEMHKLSKHDPIEMVRTTLANYLEVLPKDIDKANDKLRQIGAIITTRKHDNEPVLVIEGKMVMRKRFLPAIIDDKTILYEINKDKYKALGFEEVTTIITSHGRFQKTYVLEINGLYTSSYSSSSSASPTAEDEYEPDEDLILTEEENQIIMDIVND